MILIAEYTCLQTVVRAWTVDQRNPKRTALLGNQEPHRPGGRDIIMEHWKIPKLSLKCIYSVLILLKWRSVHKWFFNVSTITIVVYRLEDNPNEVIRCLATSSKDSTIQSVEVTINTALSQRQYDPVNEQSK